MLKNEKDIKNNINDENKINSVYSFIRSNSFSSFSVNSKNEENRLYLDSSIASIINIDIEKLKMGSKILCPQENCFLNSIISTKSFFF